MEVDYERYNRTEISTKRKRTFRDLREQKKKKKKETFQDSRAKRRWKNAQGLKGGLEIKDSGGDVISSSL